MKKLTIDMKKLFVLAGTALVMASCSQDVLVDNAGELNSVSDKIEFGLSMADNATKASRPAGKTFVDGDKIAVFGYQIMDSDTSKLFNDQVVSFNGTKWSYQPVKYWTGGSTYEFYSMFPCNLVSHSFSDDSRLFSIPSFTVANDAAQQIDVMIAKQKLNVKPFNTVDFVFTHMLSNVNFYFKGIDNSVSAGVQSVEILNFDVTGLNATGEYVQSGWNTAGAPEGMWMVDADSEYDMPEVQNVSTLNQKVDIITDLLLMPQDIQSESMVSVKYRINYTDGTSSTLKKAVPFAAIIGKSQANGSTRPISSWFPAYRYNYYLTVNPSKMNGGNGTDTTDKNDTDRPADKVVIQIPDTDGDLEDEYWIDEDGDGTPDYPLVWDDPDGDGTQNLYPDHDGDGIPDYRDPEPGKDPEGNDYTGDTDGDGIPDDLWIDEDGDGDAETEPERTTPIIKDVPDSIPTNPNDPSYPDTFFVDYNGGVGEYQTPHAYLVKDANGDYYVVDSLVSTSDSILVLWKDIDGDGRLEGIADRDGDGVLTENDTYDHDGMDYNGKTNYYDVIMVDTDGDGIAETELEREKVVTNPDLTKDLIIEFSAEVEDWIDAYDVNINVTQ